MSKTLILLRGLPGCGKTTLADELITDPYNGFGFGVMLAADDYFTDEFTGEYTFDPSKLSQAHEQCRQRCETCMRNDVGRIVVHNTFTTKKEMKPYYDLAKEHGYMVHSLIVENRHGGENTHNVPEHSLERMEQRFDVRLRDK